MSAGSDGIGGGSSAALTDPWSIVLAGGEGERLQPFIRRWLGEVRPKQYCTFLGTRSLLQHTVDRADALSSSTRRIVVAAPHHAPYLREQMRGREGGRVVFQPRNCGTAPGIFLPLTHVLTRDPHATVVIYPSDHFVEPEHEFANVVARATAASRALGGRPVILGVKAECSEGDYGWIQPGAEIARSDGQPVWSVERFVEKPGSNEIVGARGAFWNTFVIVGSVHMLWRLGIRYAPEIMLGFAQLLDSVGTPREAEVLKEIYEAMPVRDFSSDILERAVEHLALMSLEGVEWSDWGRQDRVVETLERLGVGFELSHDRIFEEAHEETSCGSRDRTLEMSR